MAWANLALVVGTLLAYGQVVRCDFVNFDDPDYVLNNIPIQSGLWDEYGWGFNLDTLLWAFTETRIQGHWHPLTWLSLALDHQIFGLRPWGYHLTNLLLHLGSTLLLLRILHGSTGSVWHSAAVAGLFAWHPLHVESVAWITERKDTLSTFFWMLTMWAYVRHVERPTMKSYVLIIFFFVLGLLSKPMIVTLPCVLLLWDYWPLGRFPFAQRNTQHTPRSTLHIVLEKLPLLVLSLASALWTWWVMRDHIARKPTMRAALTPLGRVDNILWSYVAYLRKMIWPVDLAVYYPAPPATDVTFDAYGPALVIALCTALALFTWRTRPYLLVGWLWYVGTLFPVSGRWQAGSYATADRYTYVPLIGIFIALVWGLHDLARSPMPRRIARMATSAVLGACIVLTFQQVQIWRNSETLWRHALAWTTDNFVAHTNLAAVLEEDGRGAEAIEHYRRALELMPRQEPAYRRLAKAYQKAGQADEAVAILRQVVAMAPDDWSRRLDLAQALRAAGRALEARQEEEEGERLYRSHR